jgi:hypothetical protein
MGWSNFVYLLVGLGLGIGSGWYLWRSRTQVPATATSQAADQDGENLLEQLQQTRLAYCMATEMSQFKAGFLARTSHELRSPLSSLIGLQQLILADLCDDPAEEREYIAQAHASALKMVQLLDEIIDVSKTEHGRIQLEIQPLALAEVLAEVYQLNHLQAENRNLRFQVVPPDPEVYVLADPHRFKQILLNLVDVPISLMDEGNIRVSVHISPESDYAHIWVEDQRPASAWSEPLDLLQSSLAAIHQQIKAPDRIELHKPEPSAQTGSRSPGLTLLLNQTLLEQMQGHLEVLAVPAAPENLEASQIDEFSNLTRIQCSIPLVPPEVE